MGKEFFDVKPGDRVTFSNGATVIVAKVDSGNLGTRDAKNDDLRYARVYWHGKGPHGKPEFKCMMLSEVVAVSPHAMQPQPMPTEPKEEQKESQAPVPRKGPLSHAKSPLDQIPGAIPCDCGKKGTTVPNGKCRVCLDCGQGVGSCSI